MMVQEQQRRQADRSAGAGICRSRIAGKVKHALLAAVLGMLAAAPASAVTPAVAQPVQTAASATPSTLVSKPADAEAASPVPPSVALLLAALAVALYLGSRGSRD
jgi:hypothetical protein